MTRTFIALTLLCASFSAQISGRIELDSMLGGEPHGYRFRAPCRSTRFAVEPNAMSSTSFCRAQTAPHSIRRSRARSMSTFSSQGSSNSVRRRHYRGHPNITDCCVNCVALRSRSYCRLRRSSTPEAPPPADDEKLTGRFWAGAIQKAWNEVAPTA